MLKGILRLRKSAKGGVIVELDRLMSGRAPMPLSYVSLPNLDFNDKDCEYLMDGGRITLITVGKTQVFPAASAPPRPQPSGGGEKLPAGTVNQLPDSFNIRQTRTPDYLSRANISDVDNFNLKFHKAARIIPGKDKFYFYKNDYRKSRDGRESGDAFMIRANYGHIDFDQIAKRLENMAAAQPDSRRITFSPDWRFILGIGGANIYETGITLHHIYGFPYIPASSIKGLTRSWIVQNCFGTETDSEATAFSRSKLLCDVFGCPEEIPYGDEKPRKKKPSYYKIHEKRYGFSEKQGSVFFFDAMPTKAPRLEIDIMNVHYPDYYNDSDNNKSVAPTDFQNPNPIPFLAVGKDSPFISFISAKKEQTIEALDPDFGQETPTGALLLPEGLTGKSSVLEFAEAWLKKALTEHGIGAKTAVGYGFMQ